MNKRTWLEEQTPSGSLRGDIVEKEKEVCHLKVVKNDNAWVPMELWEEYLLCPFPHQTEILSHPGWPKALRVLQQFGLQMWQRNKLHSYMWWKHKNNTSPSNLCHKHMKQPAMPCSMPCWPLGGTGQMDHGPSFGTGWRKYRLK